MKSEEKKLKNRENVRDVILSAAKKLFVAEGFKSTSIRKIAAEVGVSPTTIYLYYKDKNEIVHALHQEGFVKLRTMLLSLKNVDSPFERLKATGRTYIQFALENPEYYEVMFVMREPLDFLAEDEKDPCWEEGRLIFNFIRYTIEECQKDGFFLGSDVNAVTLQSWALVHGLCSLHTSTHLTKVVQNNVTTLPLDTIVETTFTAFINFIERTKNN